MLHLVDTIGRIHIHVPFKVFLVICAIGLLAGLIMWITPDKSPKSKPAVQEDEPETLTQDVDPDATVLNPRIVYQRPVEPTTSMSAQTLGSSIKAARLPVWSKALIGIGVVCTALTLAGAAFFGWVGYKLNESAVSDTGSYDTSGQTRTQTEDRDTSSSDSSDTSSADEPIPIFPSGSRGCKTPSDAIQDDASEGILLDGADNYKWKYLPVPYAYTGPGYVISVDTLVDGVNESTHPVFLFTPERGGDDGDLRWTPTKEGPDRKFYLLSDVSPGTIPPFFHSFDKYDGADQTLITSVSSATDEVKVCMDYEMKLSNWERRTGRRR